MGWISSSLAAFLQSHAAQPPQPFSQGQGQGQTPGAHVPAHQHQQGVGGDGQGYMPNGQPKDNFGPPPMPPSMLGPNASPGFPAPVPGMPRQDHRGVSYLPSRWAANPSCGAAILEGYRLKV